ncbi:MAG: flippase [Candidatus Paceibacteria bacterium]
MSGKSMSKTVVKNSAYNITGTLITKLGGLIFTIVLARILAPEYFGIYSLVLSVVGLAVALTDLGSNKTLVRYVSEALGHNDKTKARAYIRFLLKFRFFLAIGVILIIIVFGKFIAEGIFQKPEVYHPLLFATLLILGRAAFQFFKAGLTAVKDWRSITKLQFVQQVLRIGLVLVALQLITTSQVEAVFVSLAIAFFLTALAAFIYLDRELVVGRVSGDEFDKPRVLKYIAFMSFTVITLKLFGSIDNFILGRFVESEFLGFYRAALSLATSVGALYGFGGVFLPIFTQIHGNRLERGFEKSFKFVSILAIPSAIGLVIVSKHFITAIYGKEYLTGAIPLYALALTIVIMPFVGLYSSLVEAKERPKILFRYTLVSLVLNIVLNFVLILWLLKFGQEYAILGAGIATVATRGFYMLAIATKSKKFTGIKGEKRLIARPLLAAGVMAAFLILSNQFVSINPYFGIIQIMVGAIIYFAVLFWIKGITKNELRLFKNVFVKKLKGNKH